MLLLLLMLCISTTEDLRAQVDKVLDEIDIAQSCTKPLIKWHAFKTYNAEYDELKKELLDVYQTNATDADIKIKSVQHNLYKMAMFAIEYYYVEAKGRVLKSYLRNNEREVINRVLEPLESEHPNPDTVALLQYTVKANNYIHDYLDNYEYGIRYK